ncbi:all development altered-6 [Apiospora marii]|uniref:All development altered-6 n=1 Tax=Apiospora marii TaxID=335849 RepID=A0ABR1SU36_9PEZI
MSSNFSFSNDIAPQHQEQPPRPRPRQQLGSACDECRKRKLRCDRNKPQCLGCATSGLICITRNDCAPRGPKKGHLSALRSKIATLEARLNEQQVRDQPSPPPTTVSDQPQTSENDEQGSDSGLVSSMSHAFSADPAGDFNNISAWLTLNSTHPPPNGVTEDPYPAITFPPVEPSPVGLQLNPLVCSDLDQLYFDRVHTFAPMLQKSRYLAWSRKPDKSKAQVCLQYAMWTLAASLSSQFQTLRRELYAEARRLLEAFASSSTESGGGGGHQDDHQPKWCVEHPQAWILLAIYELTNDEFQRGLVTSGRAFRLIQLMRLHEVDRHPPAGFQGDWVEVESLRRTFWIAYCFDRFTGVADDLPLTFNENEIETRLPAPDSHFSSGQPIVVIFLSEISSGFESGWPDSLSYEAELSPFAESVVVATICSRASALKRRQHAAATRSGGGAGGVVGTHQQPPERQDFYRQHQCLSTLLAGRLQILALQISSMSGHSDPVLLFLAITAQMTILVLGEMIESAPPGLELQETMLADHKRRSLDATRNLGMLIAVLGQLNHFQVGFFSSLL